MKTSFEPSETLKMIFKQVKLIILNLGHEPRG